MTNLKETEEQQVCLNQCENESKMKKNEEDSPLWHSKITLEPLWLGVTISMTMGVFAFKNLFLQRACLVELNYTEEVCLRSEGELKTKVELESQALVSSVMVGGSFFSGFVTGFLLIFLGPWSDSSGRRKPLIILPIAAMMCMSLALLIFQAFPRVPATYIIYTEVMLLAIGGNFSMLIMSGFNYLGDICYKTNRCTTVVMGSNSAFLSIYMLIGSLIGPFIIRYLGFVGVFSISLVLEITSLLFAIFRIKDVNIAPKIPNVFDYTLPLKAIKCIFKRRIGNQRKIVWLMTTVPCCNTMIYVADLSITYLYLRNKFQWTEIEYGFLLAFRSILHSLGSFLIVHLLKAKLNIPDKYIGVIGGISTSVAAIAFMFSYNTLTIFGSSVLGVLARGAMIAERPILNRQIKANEQGQINCVQCVFEKCVSFIVVPLCTFLYSRTLNVFPTTYNVICVLAGIVQALCYAFVQEKTPEVEMKSKDSEIIL